MEIEWSKEQNVVFSAQGNTLVSASAGSGKTTVLIEKILRLIEGGTDIRRILVMTFSRASATDMKNKLVEKIYSRLSFGQTSDLLRRQLENVPFSGISTINSFCYSLLKKYFSVVGADPSCTILEEEEAKQLLDECLDRVLEREIEGGEDNFLKTLEFFSQRRKTDGIKEVVLSLRSFLCAQEDPEAFLKNADGSDGSKAEEYYLCLMKKRASKLGRKGESVLRLKKDEQVAEKEEEYKEIVLRLRRAADGDLPTLFRELTGLEVPKAFLKSAVEKGKMSETLLEQSTEFLHAATALKKDAEKGLSLYDKKPKNAFVVDVVIDLYRKSEEEYAFRKKQRSAVDFGDAERAALTILKNEQYREEIRNNYDYVFIDEYQDTNYLQEALLKRICKGDNLFAVGDVKQAIYLFRYAEPEIFNERRRMYDNIIGEGTNCQLNDNYRSCDAVLDFTNQVCAEVMTEDFGGVDYASEAMLRGGLKLKGEEDAVTVYTYTGEGKEKVERGKIYRVKTAPKKIKRDREAVFIAEETEKLVAAGKKYEDIAVLVRANKYLDGIAEAFRQKNIPFYISKEQKSVFPERETLIDCLRLLNNDNDDISLLNVLHGEWMGFSAEELLKIRLYDKKLSFSDAFRGYAGEEEIEKKRDEFLSKTERWRFMGSYLPVADLLRIILKEGYDAVLLKKREVMARINAFILFVEKQAQRMSVGEFLRYYDTVYNGNTPPAPPSAVTLMTLHGSKGLEFPVIFLPYVSKPFGGARDSGALVCDRDFGMSIKNFDEDESQAEQTFPLHVLGLKKAHEEKEGELRLTYVAFTRAKEKLIISGEEKSFSGEAEDARCIMDWLLLTARRNGAFTRYFHPLPEPEEEASVCPPARPKGLDLTCLEKKYPFEEATKQFAKTSVSGILEKSESVGVRIIQKEDNDAKALLGTAMHAVLRYVDFSVESAEEVGTEVKKMVGEGLLSEEEGKVVDCEKIFAVLHSPELLAVKDRPMYREYPFIFHLRDEENQEEGALVQGVIDLLVDLPDGSFMLLDYKMSSLGPQMLKERYTEQLVLYKTAVEKILKKPVSKTYLYNIERGFCVPL